MRKLTFSLPVSSRLVSDAAAALARQRGRLFLFVPIFLGCGIGAYFVWPVEPGLYALCVTGLTALIMAGIAWQVDDSWSPILGAVTLALLGFVVAGLRAESVASPVLTSRYYGPIEGRIVKIDRSSRDLIRLTLDQVYLGEMRPERVPEHVRISLHGPQDLVAPEPGLRVMLTGHLGPPPAPSEPGGFDFRRMAWFERLGGVGYTRSPVLVAANAQEHERALIIHRLRLQISRAVQDRLPGDAGAFATAILTGDRSAIPEERLEDLRKSNLAHLLAISGLHMGLLTGFVFGLLRLGLALHPWVALRWPTRKLAAIGALTAGAFYLALSGGNVATQRAFIMVSVMFIAVILDRQALSLRSVALAAVLILLMRPEALVQAGFQMSFAATIALVAVFRAINDYPAQRRRVPRWAWPILSVVICSVVAGLATAPVAAASFNRLTSYGLIANLLAVPLMGTIIMPAAVLSALLTPFGLEWMGLGIMRPAILWILQVAQQVSALDGSVHGVVQPPNWVLPQLTLGALWLILWQGRARWAGPLVMAFAFAGWAGTNRPDLLIAPEGQVIGVLTAEGRALSRDRAGSFVAESWLQADGDLASQAQAFARTGQTARSPVTRLALADGTEVIHLAGKDGLAQVSGLCHAGRIVVANSDPPRGMQGPCTLIAPRDLRDTGARAAYVQAGGLYWVNVRETGGGRHWSR